MYSSENEIMEGECAMFINGIPVDLEYFDIYNFLDVLKVEEKLADGFFRLGLQVMILILVIILFLHFEKNKRSEKNLLI